MIADLLFLGLNCKKFKNMPCFGVLDSNDTWATHCMSLGCSTNHTLGQ